MPAATACQPRDTSCVTERGTFRATIRYWRPELESGLAVVDIAPDVVTALGGLKQIKVRGSINGIEFVSNTMPAGGGRLALSLNWKLLAEAGLMVHDEATFELERLES